MSDYLPLIRRPPDWRFQKQSMSTADTVIAYFDQILQTVPTAVEEAHWVVRIDASANRSEAIEDLVETLLLRASDARSVLHLNMSFLDRPPANEQLDALVGLYHRIREADPDPGKKEALVHTIREWLASERGPLQSVFEFSEEDFRSILFLRLLFD